MESESFRPPASVPRGSVVGERRTMQQLPKIDYLQFGPIIGFGHFSHVYEGLYRNKFLAAVKVIERGSERLVEREIEILARLRHIPHIIQLYEVIQEENYLLVFELFKGMDQEAFFEEVTVDRLRFVLQCLFRALKFAHRNNIVHRDIKLGNILVSTDWQDVKLIDWGCGCEIKDRLSAKAGSRTVRSPEMLMGYGAYGIMGDMWAMGALIYYILCGGDIPWKAATSGETIALMASFIGRRKTFELAKHYGYVMTPELEEDVRSAVPRKWRDSYSPDLGHLRDPDLIDLMHRLLCPDMEDRLTAEQALDHGFFTECV
jgi:serine/threonine protein kinase